MNTTLISWNSKKKSPVETLSSGEEFIAIKQGIDALWEIIYKFIMMGIPTSGSTYIG